MTSIKLLFDELLEPIKCDFNIYVVLKVENVRWCNYPMIVEMRWKKIEYFERKKSCLMVAYNHLLFI